MAALRRYYNREAIEVLADNLAHLAQANANIADPAGVLPPAPVFTPGEALPGEFLGDEAVRAAADRLGFRVASPPSASAREKARVMLERVVRITGARLMSPEEVYKVSSCSYQIFTTGEAVYSLAIPVLHPEIGPAQNIFMISTQYIVRIRSERGEATCYQVQRSVPPEEKIAIALLYLKRDPRSFYELAAAPGRWIK